jgi:hypothetical protein
MARCGKGEAMQIVIIADASDHIQISVYWSSDIEDNPNAQQFIDALSKRLPEVVNNLPIARGDRVN